jgi:two-component system, OmpR family, phosphate regulon response regulator PhoB
VAITVLVVEDDELVADVVRINLEAEGFTVVHAPNGAAALATIAQQRPDLVLLDVMMPEIDGWTVLTRLRDDPQTAKLPVIMLTAKSMPADQVRGYNLGANGYVPKPFAAPDLVEKVRAVLADSAAT